MSASLALLEFSPVALEAAAAAAAPLPHAAGRTSPGVICVSASRAQPFGYGSHSRGGEAGTSLSFAPESPRCASSLQLWHSPRTWPGPPFPALA